MKNSFIRKRTRLNTYNYSLNGAYFLTLCVEDASVKLSQIVAGGVLDAPQVLLTEYGKIAENRLLEMERVYDYIEMDNYVIMPNHIHILLRIENEHCFETQERSSQPANEIIPRFVSTFKRMTNKAYHMKIWQRDYNDRIIRNEKEYLNKWRYIDENPKKWLIGKDKYYSL